jgi:glutamate N-acetyltransferase/amino-acid N-acetyltransferase
VAKELGVPSKDIIVASTGVIGRPLSINPIDANVKRLVESLSDSGSDACSGAIMTTDTIKKEIAVEFSLGKKTCRIGAVAKGSGMIHPNMGTMLCFITTDVDITSAMLDMALSLVAEDTFNMVTVDGDTSTNDMAVILANGCAGNAQINDENEDYRVFLQALMVVCIYIARMTAKDGEGASKLLECTVSGAPDDETARKLAKAVLSSSLFKAAMAGADANWGRALCAMGYSGAGFDPAKVSIMFASGAGNVVVCDNGVSVSFSETKAKAILSEDEIEINIQIGDDDGEAVAWGCDLTTEYVKINGDYRS